MANPELIPTEPKKSGNIWKWLGCGCGGTLLLGIGLIGGLIYYGLSKLNVSFDSQKAETVAKSIVDYKIPGGSRGFVSAKIQEIELAGVTSAENFGDVLLVVARFPKGTASIEDVKKAIQQSMTNQNSGQFEVKSEHQETEKLCGQDVSVTISTGESTSGSNSVPTLNYQAAVTSGDKVLYIDLKTEGKEAKTNATEIFNSLQCK